MTQTPLHIQALRGAAIVLALGAGSWLVVNSQRAANPKPEPDAPEPIAEPQPGEALPVTGDPFPAPAGADRTFIYGSKSFVPEAAAVLTPPLTEPGQGATLPGATPVDLLPKPGQTFLYSSKSMPIDAFKKVDAPSAVVSPAEPEADKAPTFMHSSKTLNLTQPGPKLINFPPSPKASPEPEGAKGSGQKKATDSPPKQ